jgi:RND family efflux transporter MFP subunit
MGCLRPFDQAPVLLLLSLVSLSCSRDPKVEAKTEATSPPAVAVAKARPDTLSSDLTLTAEFRPYQEVEVHAKVAGYLKQISVDIGDRVTQGQLLATLEIPELADDLAQAQANENRSQAQLLQARGELERAKSAHAMSHLSYSRLAAVMKTRPNLVAQQEIDEAQARDRVSEAQIAAAEAGITASEQQVAASKASRQHVKTLSAYSQITAPFAGVVTKRYADTGSMIQAGTASQTQTMPVVRISQVDRLRLVLPVPESIVPRIRVGTSVQVSVDSLQRVFPGRIARFTGKVQSATRTMETEVDVPNPGMVLMPGMYASTVLTLERRANVLTVPIAAVANRDTKPSVLLVNANKVLEERPIKLGMESAERAEVQSGLNNGDLVIVAGREGLKAGQRVEPKLTETVSKDQR